VVQNAGNTVLGTEMLSAKGIVGSAILLVLVVAMLLLWVVEAVIRMLLVAIG